MDKMLEKMFKMEGTNKKKKKGGRTKKTKGMPGLANLGAMFDFGDMEDMLQGAM